MKKESSNLKEIQKLLGKLHFAATTVRSGRVFVTRLINLLKKAYKTKKAEAIIIREEDKKDILWWRDFMKGFDGVSMMPATGWGPPDSIIQSDSCLTECGVWTDGEFWHSCFPEEIM